MVIITIKRKLLSAIIIAILIALLGFSYYQYRGSALPVSANNVQNIEIFDIGKGSVLKVVPLHHRALTEAKKILKSITGMYIKVNAFPDKGYIIRIPFEPKMIVKNQWINDCKINAIDKLFVIFPEAGTPYILILDDKEKPYLFNFESDVELLLEILSL